MSALLGEGSDGSGVWGLDYRGDTVAPRIQRHHQHLLALPRDERILRLYLSIHPSQKQKAHARRVEVRAFFQFELTIFKSLSKYADSGMC